MKRDLAGEGAARVLHLEISGGDEEEGGVRGCCCWVLLMMDVRSELER